jgi:site-specific DNA recombinase
MTKDDLNGLYARVSGDRQEKEDTIASQIEAIIQRIANEGLECHPDLHFVDDGYSGDILARPGLERLRDKAAAGVIDRLYVLDPDRFSRKYAYQVLMLEELARCGVEVIFLKNPPGHGPEENLLLQVQGMIAEYERAKIMDRCRRGKQYAARRGSVNVLSGAPYGYRYIGRHEGGGEARYQVVAEEARVVRKIFEWIGQERCSIGEVCRRLQREGVPTRTGKTAWDRATIWLMLKNPAYKGTAAFGKTRSGDLKPQRLRPQRGRPDQPRRPISRVDTSSKDQIFIDVPGLVGEELFGAVQAQLEENRQRRRDRPGGGRYLLQGLVVCKRCGYGCYGKPVSRASTKGKVRYAYYRCTGSDAYRFGGQRLCWNKQIRTDILDGSVWEDVSQLLSEPERVRAEYQRRLERGRTGQNHESEHINKMIKNIKKLISRLIDAYGEGLLDKSEFEPRILAAKERLAKWEEECRRQASKAAEEAELRLVIGQLEEFARRVSEELQEPSWERRREVVRALVKRVEIDEQEVRIVYRVSPSPFERGPQQRSLLHCWGRDYPSLRCPLFRPRHGRPSLLVSFEHGSFQPHPDQRQHRTIGDPLLQTGHQLVVRNRVEVGLEVSVVNLLSPGLQVLANRIEGLMCVLAWAKPE